MFVPANRGERGGFWFEVFHFNLLALKILNLKSQISNLKISNLKISNPILTIRSSRDGTGKTFVAAAPHSVIWRGGIYAAVFLPFVGAGLAPPALRVCIFPRVLL
jgi:hypothetical protein